MLTQDVDGLVVVDGNWRSLHQRQLGETLQRGLPAAFRTRRRAERLLHGIVGIAEQVLLHAIRCEKGQKACQVDRGKGTLALETLQREVVHREDGVEIRKLPQRQRGQGGMAVGPKGRGPLEVREALPQSSILTGLDKRPHLFQSKRKAP